MEDNILTQEQKDKIVAAFFSGRAAQDESPPTEQECASVLWWFNEIARGAVLMQWVLDGSLMLNMNENVIAFVEMTSDGELSPLIMQQLESMDSGENDGV